MSPINLVPCQRYVILRHFVYPYRLLRHQKINFLLHNRCTLDRRHNNLNDLKASYLTYQDEYWSLYYYKPYTRIHGYLVGLWFGCIFYSYKHENPEVEEAGEEEAADEEESKAKPVNFINDTLNLM